MQTSCEQRERRIGQACRHPPVTYGLVVDDVVVCADGFIVGHPPSSRKLELTRMYKVSHPALCLDLLQIVPSLEERLHGKRIFLYAAAAAAANMMLS